MLEKLTDRRIDAHEQVLRIAQQLRTTTLPPANRDASLARRVPSLLTSRDEYNGWRSHFAEVVNANDHWLEDDVRRHLYFLQDYFLNLDPVVNDQSVDLSDLGTKIRSDFIDGYKTNKGPFPSHPPPSKRR